MKSKRNKIFLLIFAVLLQNISASNNNYDEGDDQQQSNQPSNQQSNYNGNQNNQYTDGSNNQKSVVDNTNNLASRNILTSNNNNRNTNYAGNGALFGQTNPFPIMDSNGRVSVAPEYYSRIGSNNGINNLNAMRPNPQGYDSSEVTPAFPSYLGRRLRGVPTHFDANMNMGMMNQQGQAIQTAYRKQLSLPLSPSVVPKTEVIDQGPLAPAPKSPLEQAGWWEYLALLFGDSGDATAVRLILHRLTRLAQLQMEGDEATKVQAATAFLAHHFKPLLVSSFQDFVYDPDYNRNTSMWSSDPGFSNIIRQLVDRMDFFGAQDELERIFGPNTSVAVSFGMRQPEWLRLKLILEQIAWDLRHPNDLIGLWSPAWKLTVDQKLSILAYASNPKVNTPLDLNLPYRDSILARINLITNGEAPVDKTLIQKESPLEQAHFKYALLQSGGNMCKALKSDVQGANASQQQQQLQPQQSQSATTVEADGFKRRVGDYCELVNLTPNFNQFCQSGTEYSTPIASLLSASGPLFDEKVVKYINHLERLFWAFTWVGAKKDARESLATLTNQLKTLGPKEKYIKKNKRVPTGVSESIHVRLEYMQSVQNSGPNNYQLVGSANVAYIFSLLNYAHLTEALSEWERRYSAVAIRLQGYPGGPLIASGEEQLLYQEARSVRIALLIYKYPRSVYVPCLSKGLLTRDPATDLTLLNLTLSLDERPNNGPTRIDPLIPEMSARALYLRALYLAGRDLDAARVARELAAVSSTGKATGNRLVNEFVACMELCGSATRNPCAAQKTYSQLLTGTAPQSETTIPNQGNSEEGMGEQQITGQKPNATADKDKLSTAKTVYTVGKELSTRLCRLSRNTAADALSLRYGKVLTTQATFSALKRHAEYLTIAGTGPVKSKLKASEAESILPWFVSLPPAPVEDILSFAPTQKFNFVPQVGVQGVPLITVNNANTQQGEADNANANGKIFVLGKEYNANLLTNSNGPNNTEPKTKLVNGIYQLATNNPNSNQQAQYAQNAQSGGNANVENDDDNN